MYDQEEVKESKAKKYAEEIGAIFKTTSASKVQGIEDLFKIIAKKYLSNIKNKDKDSNNKEKSEKLSKNILIAKDDKCPC